jgi:hypothetical protein
VVVFVAVAGEVECIKNADGGVEGREGGGVKHRR